LAWWDELFLGHLFGFFRLSLLGGSVIHGLLLSLFLLFLFFAFSDIPQSHSLTSRCVRRETLFEKCAGSEGEWRWIGSQSPHRFG
jgi:hypothetical protein